MTSALTTEMKHTRTDLMIVDQTEALARSMLRSVGFEAPENFVFHLSDNPRAQKAWNMACQVQEEMTQTDPNDAVSGLDEAYVSVSMRPKDPAVSYTDLLSIAQDALPILDVVLEEREEMQGEEDEILRDLITRFQLATAKAVQS